MRTGLLAQKIGMTREGDIQYKGFHHVLYRITAAQWREQQA